MLDEYTNPNLAHLCLYCFLTKEYYAFTLTLYRMGCLLPTYGAGIRCFTYGRKMKLTSHYEVT